MGEVGFQGRGDLGVREGVGCAQQDTGVTKVVEQVALQSVQSSISTGGMGTGQLRRAGAPYFKSDPKLIWLHAIVGMVSEK